MGCGAWPGHPAQNGFGLAQSLNLLAAGGLPNIEVLKDLVPSDPLELEAKSLLSGKEYKLNTASERIPWLRFAHYRFQECRTSSLRLRCPNILRADEVAGIVHVVLSVNKILTTLDKH